MPPPHFKMTRKQTQITAGSYVDLHCHSYVSADGVGYPARMAEYFKEAGFAAFSLTDHALYWGQEEARRAAAEAGIEYVPGVEITVQVDDPELGIDDRADILCYYFEATPELEVLGLQQEGFSEALSMFLNAMKAAGTLEYDAAQFRDYVESRYGELGIAKWFGIQREVLGELLIDAGMIDPAEGAQQGYDITEWSRQEVHRHIRSYKNPSSGIGLKHACQVMRQAGGVLILAHPGIGGRTSCDAERARINKWLDNYVDGIEVFHHRNSPGYREMLLDIAMWRGCPYTGGSDRHNFADGLGLSGITPGTAEAVDWNAGPAKLYGHISETPAECLRLLKETQLKIASGRIN